MQAKERERKKLKGLIELKEVTDQVSRRHLRRLSVKIHAEFEDMGILFIQSIN